MYAHSGPGNDHAQKLSSREDYLVDIVSNNDELHVASLEDGYDAHNYNWKKREGHQRGLQNGNNLQEYVNAQYGVELEAGRKLEGKDKDTTPESKVAHSQEKY